MSKCNTKIFKSHGRPILIFRIQRTDPMPDGLRQILANIETRIGTFAEQIARKTIGPLENAADSRAASRSPLCRELSVEVNVTEEVSKQIGTRNTKTKGDEAETQNGTKNMKTKGDEAEKQIETRNTKTKGDEAEKQNETRNTKTKGDEAEKQNGTKNTNTKGKTASTVISPCDPQEQNMTLHNEKAPGVISRDLPKATFSSPVLRKNGVFAQTVRTNFLQTDVNNENHSHNFSSDLSPARVNQMNQFQTGDSNKNRSRSFTADLSPAQVNQMKQSQTGGSDENNAPMSTSDLRPARYLVTIRTAFGERNRLPEQTGRCEFVWEETKGRCVSVRYGFR